MVTLESLECFCRGTLILTDRGDIPVEELRIGDLVRTVIGKSEEPVIGINQRQVDCSRHPKPRQVWPVRIAAGTFGHRRPVRELWLSPDHAVILAERLAVESYLDNGDRMVFHPDGDQVPVPGFRGAGDDGARARGGAADGQGDRAAAPVSSGGGGHGRRLIGADPAREVPARAIRFTPRLPCRDGLAHAERAPTSHGMPEFPYVRLATDGRVIADYG